MKTISHFVISEMLCHLKLENHFLLCCTVIHKVDVAIHFCLFYYFLPPRVLLPVLQQKAKKGPPRQAKYAIHCIHAMFSNRDTHFAQIFEVRL